VFLGLRTDKEAKDVVREQMAQIAPTCQRSVTSAREVLPAEILMERLLDFLGTLKFRLGFLNVRIAGESL
jgi:hypothetical protein